MLNPNPTSATDRRPFIALVPWDTGFRAWDPFDSSTGETWHPRGARLLTLSGATADLSDKLTQELIGHELSAVILVGRSTATGIIHIQTRAENRIPGSQNRDDPLAAGVVRATLSTSEILRDLADEGLSARAVSAAEDDAGSHLLFRILSQLPDHIVTPPVGLMRLPRDMAPEQVNQAIRTVASSVARHLPHLTTAA